MMQLSLEKGLKTLQIQKTGESGPWRLKVPEEDAQRELVKNSSGHIYFNTFLMQFIHFKN